jgi:hypothetical protein
MVESFHFEFFHIFAFSLYKIKALADVMNRKPNDIKSCSFCLIPPFCVMPFFHSTFFNAREKDASPPIEPPPRQGDNWRKSG